MTRVYADAYTVTNTAASGPGSLRQAILDANGNPGHDTIDFGVNGTIVLTDALPAIGDDLTISGPGAEQLSISGDNAYRVFSITNGVAVTITAVTVRDGYANNGGGIWSAGTLQLNSARIVSNTTGDFFWPNGQGGGVFIYQGSATLSGTQVLSNSASSGGGVCFWEGNATLNISGGEIGGNSASSGGGVYVWEGSATLNETNVNNNSAHSGGGGVYVWAGSATLSETQVLNNSASYGGGVYVRAGSATLSGTQVLSNSASAWGGGVCDLGGSVTMSKTQVINNSALYGGGVYEGGGSATLSRTQVVSNSARLGGGGVYVDVGSATLNRTQVVSNSARLGGGVYVYGEYDMNGKLNVSGGEISSNSAITYGGGVYVYQDSSATLNGTNINDNSAYQGGGLYLDSSGAITVSESCVINNSDTAVHNALSHNRS
jgi:hypothetical protein